MSFDQPEQGTSPPGLVDARTDGPVDLFEADEEIDHLGGQLFSRRYDLLGREIAIEHREAGDRVYVLDAVGNAVEERRGTRRIFRQFDVLGRITLLRFDAPDASPVERYTYDAGVGERLVGRLALAEGDFGTVAYSYDGCGRLKEKTRTFADRPGETLSLAYRQYMKKEADTRGIDLRLLIDERRAGAFRCGGCGRPMVMRELFANGDRVYQCLNGVCVRRIIRYQYQLMTGRITEVA